MQSSFFIYFTLQLPLNYTQFITLREDGVSRETLIDSALTGAIFMAVSIWQAALCADTPAARIGVGVTDVAARASSGRHSHASSTRCSARVAGEVDAGEIAASEIVGAPSEVISGETALYPDSAAARIGAGIADVAARTCTRCDRNTCATG